MLASAANGWGWEDAATTIGVAWAAVVALWIFLRA